MALVLVTASPVTAEGTLRSTRQISIHSSLIRRFPLTVLENFSVCRLGRSIGRMTEVSVTSSAHKPSMPSRGSSSGYPACARIALCCALESDVNLWCCTYLDDSEYMNGTIHNDHVQASSFTLGL